MACCNCAPRMECERASPRFMTKRSFIGTLFITEGECLSALMKLDEDNDIYRRRLCADSDVLRGKDRIEFVFLNAD